MSRMDAMTVQALIDLLTAVEDKGGTVTIDGCDCSNPAVGISVFHDGIIIANDITARDYDDLRPPLGKCKECGDQIAAGQEICEDCAREALEEWVK